MISIALATYNGSRFLQEQIDSILEQTFIDFELIICDDCSTDETYAILQNYEKKDPRIRIYQNEYNLGFKKISNMPLLCVKEISLLSVIKMIFGNLTI